MNPGIYYLYEYENGCRVKNVGFIKISRHYRSCIFQIRARGLPLGNGTSLQLHAFYIAGSRLTGSKLADILCFSGMISVRLPVPESMFPGQRTLGEIDGFLIRLPGDPGTSFWAASALPVNLDLKQYTEITPEPEVPVEEKDDAVPINDESEDDGSASDNTVSSFSTDCVTEKPSAVRIDRSGIRRLQKKFWPLANNSFLLHGYRNYGHLLLLEEQGRLWLGVPGIYDPREARAADLFGFPRFTNSYRNIADLSEEECGAEFGHWLRCVGSSHAQNEDIFP